MKALKLTLGAVAGALIGGGVVAAIPGYSDILGAQLAFAVFAIPGAMFGFELTYGRIEKAADRAASEARLTAYRAEAAIKRAAKAEAEEGN